MVSHLQKFRKMIVASTKFNASRTPKRYQTSNESLKLCLDVDIGDLGIELGSMPNQPSIGIRL